MTLWLQMNAPSLAADTNATPYRTNNTIRVAKARAG